LVGANNFVVKPTANNVKIQTADSDSYRKTIKFLNKSKAEFHTYQAHDEKSFRIVIGNIYPLTSTTEIGIAINKIEPFRSVSNVLSKNTKIKLPIFFIDLEPAEIIKNTFHITSLLNTKVIIKEPYKRCTIIQDPAVKRDDLYI